MIYRNSYFKKELRQAYIENTISFKRKWMLGIFLGLVSFAAYFVLQTLQESVLAEAVPELMQPSFFSTVYLYVHAALLLITGYFMIHYDYLFFSEIRRNAWYLLVKMRYNPAGMISAKLSALLYSTILIYTIGFIFTLLLTVFLKFSFVFAYMPALYIIGLVDLGLVTVLSTVVSLFAKRAADARIWIFLSAVFVVALKAVLGFYNILKNRVLMQNAGNLFDISRSPFMVITAALLLVCGAVSVVRAARLARYYSLPADEVYGDVPPDVSVVVIAGKSQKALGAHSKRIARRRKIFDRVAIACLIIFICAALAFNVFVILIGTATPGSEVTIKGVIPYVFRSDTMEPDIMVNDLVYFRRIGGEYEIEAGQIVLFKHNNIVYVERVIQRQGGMLDVDIDNYPPTAQPGSMAKTVSEQAVYGVYSGRSRWLGALILFANTIIGRILFLLVPAVLLFYRARITKLYKGIR